MVIGLEVSRCEGEPTSLAGDICVKRDVTLGLILMCDGNAARTGAEAVFVEVVCVGRGCCCVYSLEKFARSLAMDR